MELPQLFGSDYVLPAIIAVLLLLAVLGILILRQRAKTRAAAGGGGRQQPQKTSRQSRKAAALAAKAEREALEAAGPAVGQMNGGGAPTGDAGATTATGETGATAEGAAPFAPRPAHEPASAPGPGKGSLAEAGPISATAVDPLQRVLASILQGWGDIAAEDTNRLAVFRRDKVIAALAAIEVPKEGKGNEYARTRLTQLRRFAGQMEQTAHPARAESTAQEFAGIGPSTPPVAAAGSGGVAAAGAAGGAAAGATAGATAGAVVFGAASQTAATSAPSAGARRSWYASEADAVVATPEPTVEIAKKVPMPREWTSTPTGEDTAESEVSAGEERAAEFNWGAGEESLDAHEEIKAIDLSWNHEPAAVAAPEPVAIPAPEPTAMPEAPSPLVESPQSLNTDEASRSAEAAVAAAAAAFWGTPDAERLEQSAGAFGKSVTSAADLLTLPDHERAELLPFLEPGELVKVFRSVSDKGLKKAVVDTLENVGNPASLDAIHFCLEDSDPEVQLYALDAAERMLGKAL